MDSLTILRETADGKSVRIKNPCDTGPIIAEVIITKHDRTHIRYEILLRVVLGTNESLQLNEELLEVRERPSCRQLPIRCLARHIIEGGIFCLGYGPTEPKPPKNMEEGNKRWECIKGFLLQQYLMEENGCWPDPAWPHSEKAARKQLELDQLMQRLPDHLLEFLKKKESHTSISSRLQFDFRGMCPCGSERKMEICHGPEIKKYLALRREIDACEQETWEALKRSGSKCWGSYEDCPQKTRCPLVGPKLPCG